MIVGADPGKIALSFKDKSITYAELHNSIDTLMNLFKLTAIQSRVIIFSENRPEWVTALYAIWMSDGVVVPVDVFSNAEDVAHIITDCRPSLVIYSNQTADVLKEAESQTGMTLNTINVDQLTGPESSNANLIMNPDLDNTAVIMYTSGTTGKPKGVMLSFKNIMAVRDYLVNEQYYSDKDTVIGILPFHHILPLQGTIFVPLSTGAHTVIVDQLNADAIMSALQTHSVTVFIGVPRLYRMLMDGMMKKINKSVLIKTLFKVSRAFGSYALASTLFKKVQKAFGGHIRYMVSGGSKLDPQMVRDFGALGFRLLDGYGLTETAPMICNNPINGIKIGSVGKINPGIEVKIVEGEIVVKGANVMQGYYNNPEATEAVLKDGWFYTGDRGHLDTNGYLYVTGRIKEIIVLPNGKNINPEEVERAVYAKSPIIKEIGVYEEGDGLGAVVVPDFVQARKEGVVNLSETIRWGVIDAYNNSVPSYRKIRKVTVTKNELPKTKLGKLRRFMLKDLTFVEEGPSVKVPEPSSEEYALIKEYFQETGRTDIRAFHHLELDLGLDSLDKIELLVFIEKTFGVSLADSQLAEFSDVNALSEYIKNKKTRMDREDMNWKEILKEDIRLNLPRRVILLTLFKWVFRPLSRLYFRLEVKGIENLPKNMACIITPNHQSFMDGFMVASILRRNILRKTYFFAKEKHFKSGFRKFIAGNSNVIIMNINRELKGSIQKIGAVLKGGKNMIIFPEGARSRDGNMMPFKKTFAILSKELNVPVVPVAIKGAFEAMSVGRFFPKPGKIKLEFLKPVYPDSLDYQAIIEQTQAMIQSKVYPIQTEN